MPAALRPDALAGVGVRAAVLDVLARTADGLPREVRIPLDHETTGVAVWYPVLDGRTVVGGCFVLERHPAAATLRSSGRQQRRSVTRYSLLDLLGESPPMLEAKRLARVAAGNTLPVLLHGESGTGKEVVAQAIHSASDRAHRPFIPVNCAALPRELVESELFGYTGGAYSGARREGAAGKFEAADGGTIFLDEISELSAAAQAALLRVLQEGEITRVGTVEPRRVDVRVIAATNRDLEQARADGSLRNDVYHRLNVLPIALVPLRERGDDVALLARRFVETESRELARPSVRLAPEVFAAFARYGWPGNVRELKNTVRRLIAVAPDDAITLADLPEPLRAGTDLDLMMDDPDAPGGRGADIEALRRILSESGTMAEAAARLGITRSTLYRRMERLGVRPGRALRTD